MKQFKPSFIPAIGWLLISAFLLTLPGSSLPKESWLDKIWADKWIHIAMFSILVFLWCRAMLRMNFSQSKLKNAFIIIAITWLAYGIAMEFVQKNFIPNRSFDVGDIIADGVGCAAGLIFGVSRYIKK